MASVRLKIQISGTRDGVDWPAPGSIVEVGDDEVASLIKIGAAEEADAVDEEADAVEETADAVEVDVETATKKPSTRAK